MTTLIQVASRVFPEIGLPAPSTVVGNTNQDAVRFLALANREGRSLAKHPWRILVKRNVITTASSAEAYALPSDFNYFVDGTFWNDSNDEMMSGPLSDQRWQADISGLLTVTVNDRFQVRADGVNNRLFVRPVPTSAESLTFFYVANSWCRSSGGQRQTAWAADNDVLLVPDYVYELGVKWRMLQSHRRDFQLELAEYQQELAKEKARDGGLSSLRILGPVEDSFPPPGRVPETGFGS